MVVWMEDNNFDIKEFDRQCEHDAELFHVGKPLPDYHESSVSEPAPVAH
jgi:hypothetical protein